MLGAKFTQINRWAGTVLHMSHKEGWHGTLLAYVLGSTPEAGATKSCLMQKEYGHRVSHMHLCPSPHPWPPRDRREGFEDRAYRLHYSASQNRSDRCAVIE